MKKRRKPWKVFGYNETAQWTVYHDTFNSACLHQEKVRTRSKCRINLIWLQPLSHSQCCAVGFNYSYQVLSWVLPISLIVFIYNLHMLTNLGVLQFYLNSCYSAFFQIHTRLLSFLKQHFLKCCLFSLIYMVSHHLYFPFPSTFLFLSFTLSLQLEYYLWFFCLFTEVQAVSSKIAQICPFSPSWWVQRFNSRYLIYFNIVFSDFPHYHILSFWCFYYTIHFFFSLAY